MTSKFKSKKGFTLVETLVAITILMISIAGPLTIASKGLTAATYAKENMMATYLAEDTIEYIKSVRDINVINGAGWLAGMDGCSSTNGSRKCLVKDTNFNGQTPSSNIQPCCNDGIDKLYIDSNNKYVHNTSGAGGLKSTPYSRSFSLEKNNSDDSRRKLTVEVSWYGGNGLKNSVVISTIIFDVYKI